MNMGVNKQPAEEFLNAVWEAQKSISAYVREKVILLAKTADAQVKALFFPEISDSGLKQECVLICREFSVRYASLILSLNRERPNLADKIWNVGYSGIACWLKMAGTKVGEDIYAEWLGKQLHLPKDPHDRMQYFSNIIDGLTTTFYIEVTKAISATRTPVPAQLIISALKVLDCKSYNSVIISWGKTKFFQETFANTDLFELLLSYPWLQEYNADVLSGELSPAINKQVHNNPNDVLKWIESPEGPRKYGLFKP